jgi:hypothetical protein
MLPPHTARPAAAATANGPRELDLAGGSISKVDSNTQRPPQLRCENCGAAFANSTHGRTKRFCSDKCRQAHRKFAPTRENGLEVPDKPSGAKNGFARC